jgi:uncharacterized repeat protein (TIGR04138 family)
MDETALTNAIREICAKDHRYRPEAYYFVLEALDFTARMLDKATKEGVERHVGGKELLDGLRLYALQEFGPMTLTVLNTWGLTVTRDFGEIVFSLVSSGKLRKTEQDRPEDFEGGYDFFDAFAEPFQPRTRRRPQGPAGAGRHHKHETGTDGHAALPAGAPDA